MKHRLLYLSLLYCLNCYNIEPAAEEIDIPCMNVDLSELSKDSNDTNANCGDNEKHDSIERVLQEIMLSDKIKSIVSSIRAHDTAFQYSTLASIFPYLRIEGEIAKSQTDRKTVSFRTGYDLQTLLFEMTTAQISKLQELSEAYSNLEEAIFEELSEYIKASFEMFFAKRLLKIIDASIFSCQKFVNNVNIGPEVRKFSDIQRAKLQLQKLQLLKYETEKRYQNAEVFYSLRSKSGYRGLISIKGKPVSHLSTKELAQHVKKYSPKSFKVLMSYKIQQAQTYQEWSRRLGINASVGVDYVHDLTKSTTDKQIFGRVSYEIISPLYYRVPINKLDQAKKKAQYEFTQVLNKAIALLKEYELWAYKLETYREMMISSWRLCKIALEKVRLGEPLEEYIKALDEYIGNCREYCECAVKKHIAYVELQMFVYGLNFIAQNMSQTQRKEFFKRKRVQKYDLSMPHTKNIQRHKTFNDNSSSIVTFVTVNKNGEKEIKSVGTQIKARRFNSYKSKEIVASASNNWNDEKNVLHGKNIANKAVFNKNLEVSKNDKVLNKDSKVSKNDKVLNKDSKLLTKENISKNDKVLNKDSKVSKNDKVLNKDSKMLTKENISKNDKVLNKDSKVSKNDKDSQYKKVR